MQETLTPSQASQIVTALCSLIVAGTLCYLVQLLISLKEEFAQMREKMAVHFTQDEAMGDRIERIEHNLDKLTKLRLIRNRRDEND